MFTNTVINAMTRKSLGAGGDPEFGHFVNWTQAKVLPATRKTGVEIELKATPNENPLRTIHSEELSNMSLFVICENPGCHFVVEVSNQKHQATRRQSILSACPECGGNLSPTCPFSGRVLVVQWLGGLPHCACCHRRFPIEPAHLGAMR